MGYDNSKLSSLYLSLLERKDLPIVHLQRNREHHSRRF